MNGSSTSEQRFIDCRGVAVGWSSELRDSAQPQERPPLQLQNGKAWKSLPPAGLVNEVGVLCRLSICQRFSLFNSAL